MDLAHTASGVLAAFVARLIFKWYANAKAYREHKAWVEYQAHMQQWQAQQQQRK